MRDLLAEWGGLLLVLPFLLLLVWGLGVFPGFISSPYYQRASLFYAGIHFLLFVLEMMAFPRWKEAPHPPLWSPLWRTWILPLAGAAAISVGTAKIGWPAIGYLFATEPRTVTATISRVSYAGRDRIFRCGMNSALVSLDIADGLFSDICVSDEFAERTPVGARVVVSGHYNSHFGLYVVSLSRVEEALSDPPQVEIE